MAHKSFRPSGRGETTYYLPLSALVPLSLFPNDISATTVIPPQGASIYDVRTKGMGGGQIITQIFGQTDRFCRQGGEEGVKNRRTSLMDDPTEYSFLCLACAECTVCKVHIF